MNVAMMNRLARGFANVDTHIEAGNAVVFCLDPLLRFPQKPHAGLSLGFIQVEEIRCMPLWDNQHMKVSNGISVPDSETQFILKQESFRLLPSTEWAGLFAMGIGLPYRAEVRGVSVALHRIAAIAESLQVGYIVTASMVSRYYVVHFKSPFTIGDAAELAACVRTA